MSSIKQVLVTGASGMLGRATVPRLLAQGYDVRLFGRDRGLLHQVFPGVPVVEGTVTCEAACYAATEGCHAVLHLAGRAHTRRDPEQFLAVNTEGTRLLANAAAKRGVEHFVLVSSVAVYGSVGTGRGVAESDPCRPDSPYGHSKWVAERHLRTLAAGSLMAYTVLRPSLVYGEHDRGNTLRMIRALDQGVFPIIGSGAVWKSMTYVENVVDVLLESLVNPAARNETFNVSDPHPYTVAGLATEIARQLGKSTRLVHLPSFGVTSAARLVERLCGVLSIQPPVTRRDVAVLTTDSVVQVARLRDRLGYEASVRLEEGLRRTVDWYLGAYRRMVGRRVGGI